MDSAHRGGASLQSEAGGQPIRLKEVPGLLALSVPGPHGLIQSTVSRDYASPQPKEAMDCRESPLHSIMNGLSLSTSCQGLCQPMDYDDVWPSSPTNVLSQEMGLSPLGEGY